MSGHVKVALTGVGGDDLFGNYSKWKYHTPWRRPFYARLRRAGMKQGIMELARFPHGGMYHNCIGAREKKHLLVQSAAASTAELLEAHWSAAGTCDVRDAVARVDVRTQLPDEFLHMTDRFSMAWSIEARTPFLSKALVDLAFRLPAGVRVDPQRYKGLLRDAVAPFVPEHSFPAKKKGFILPIAQWFRGEFRPLMRELFDDAFLERQGMFRARGVRHLLDATARGQTDATYPLWTLLMFQLWWREAGLA